MVIIDFHTHFFPDPVAEKAIPKMEASSGYPAYTDGTASGLTASMKLAGIAKSVVLPVVTNPDKVSSVNRFSNSIDSPGLVMLGSLHPKSPLWREHLDEIISFGMPGIKLHPDYQEFYPDDPELLPMFAALRDAGMVVAIHAGEDLSYKPPYGGGPARIARLLDALPGLKVMAGHMGGFRMWNEVKQCLVGRPVWMDTSFGVGFMPDAQFEDLVKQHGADYVLFGTDSPWLDQRAEIKKIQALDLGSEIEEKIFYKSALGLLSGLADQ